MTLRKQFQEKMLAHGLALLILTFFSFNTMVAQDARQTSNHGKKFEQLGNNLRSPNEYRTMDGQPGPQYWQQQVDYKIDCSLDAKEQRINGEETITYHNNSPSTLRYLWLQLDENQHTGSSPNHIFNPNSLDSIMSERSMTFLDTREELGDKYGHKIEKVTDQFGRDLDYTINITMMRIELPQPLKPGSKFVFKVKWHYYMIDRQNTPSWGRGGFEHFEKDGNYLYTIVQWYPRLCVYSDFEGWQNKQFTGRGEFALNFGDFDVKITVPSDHIVGSTGECQNYSSVLKPAHYQRWLQAQNASEPMEIVTLAEAKENEKATRSTTTKTWHYKAKNVRDFAWTASPKFIWDAEAVKNENGKKVMCMSYYGKEAYPIYNRYSTKAVAHTLKTYSKYSIPYPYPVAISVEAANGMEYPMICFNPGRAEEDGTYSEGAKKACISVTIHEVGHNYFPMIINSDERQWTWMDEGINSFVQYIAEQEFDNNYQSWGGAPHMITGYMKAPPEKLEPIMTNSENIVQFGPNAYGKPAAGLTILRETIMGRELFDYAFKEYCRRWAFKHPTPEDFFRTMEDASGVDLDWFWRGWFYGIEPVDIALDSINWYKVDLENDPVAVEDNKSWPSRKPFKSLTQRRNAEAEMEFPVEQDSSLVDFYTNYKPWETEEMNENNRTKYGETFTKEEKEAQFGDKNYYELFFSNKGGLPMPIIIEWTYKDGTKEVERIPVEIWRKNEEKFNKVFIKDKEVEGILIDPYKETADIDEENNNWPVKELPSRFQVFKKHKQGENLNPMQKAAKKEKKIIKP